MKRYILLVLCILSFANAKSQDDKKIYLPEQGDIAISFDATPVLKYVGNIFNIIGDNTIDGISGKPITTGIEIFNIEDITPDASIIGKYMITDNLAVRANVGIQLRSLTSNEYVDDDLANVTNPLNEDKLIDTRHSVKNGFSAIIGAEYRKGSNRIQGVFGGGLLIGKNRVETEYQYANALTSINQFPSSAWDATYGNYRTLSEVIDFNFLIGFAGSAGVEYFFAPKMSIGAEVNLSVYSVKEGQTYAITEGYNAAKDCVETRTEILSPGDKAVVFGTSNLGGALYMSFYF